ncbi:hypothetical protein CPB86DRAFT_516789 [Serendipita vermifera]|nr:hypothetical protein CPB86DRAFT_516789 [Serendipita vermifera]
MASFYSMDRLKMKQPREDKPVIPSSFRYLIPITSVSSFPSIRRHTLTDSTKPFEAPKFIIAVYCSNWIVPAQSLPPRSHICGQCCDQSDNGRDLSYPRGVNPFTIFSRAQTVILEKVISHNKSIRDLVRGLWYLLDDESRYHWYWFASQVKRVHQRCSTDFGPTTSARQYHTTLRQMEVALRKLCVEMEIVGIVEGE